MIVIKDWSAIFENADMRKRQRLGLFSMPSGNDSKGYRMLMREGESGLIALGFFTALCQAMATFPKEVRKEGKFVNSDGTGMELADIQEITRIRVADIRQIVGMLEKVGWVTVCESATPEETCHPHAGDVPPPCQEIPGLLEGEGEGQGEGEGKGEGEASAVTQPSWSTANGWQGISEQDRNDWGEAYPAVNLDQELAKANQWLLSNPSKAKRKQWRRFLTNWFSRTQESGGTRGFVASQPINGHGRKELTEAEKQKGLDEWNS